MEKKVIFDIVSEFINDKNWFIVDITISKDNDIEVIVEKEEGSMTLDDCVSLSRFIESKLDRDKEDFSLTVGSAGLTSPFKVIGQYKKFIGQEIEMTLKSGGKIKGTLEDATDDNATITHIVSEKVEGQKKAVKKSVTTTYEMKDIKSTKPIIKY